MTDDSKLKMNDNSSENSTYSPKRGRIGYGSSKFLSILLIILLILFFAGGIIYFFNKRLPDDGASLLQLKVTALEQKIAGLEQQLAELQGKITPSGKDSALLQQGNVLAQKGESLEKQKKPIAESKAKASPPSKQAVATEKKYHTVRKGETLYQIGKKYGISVEELRKRNNLSVDQPIRTGQKLLVSTGH